MFDWWRVPLLGELGGDALLGVRSLTLVLLAIAIRRSTVPIIRWGLIVILARYVIVLIADQRHQTYLTPDLLVGNFALWLICLGVMRVGAIRRDQNKRDLRVKAKLISSKAPTRSGPFAPVIYVYEALGYTFDAIIKASREVRGAIAMPDGVPDGFAALASPDGRRFVVPLDHGEYAFPTPSPGRYSLEISVPDGVLETDEFELS